MNEKIKISNKELTAFCLDYISKHSYFKVRTLVKICMKDQNRIDNAKLRTQASRSLAVRLTRILKRAVKLDIIEKDSRNLLYKVMKKTFTFKVI